MCDLKGKADSLEILMRVELGNWCHERCRLDTFQWFRVWLMPGDQPEAAWVRENGKGGYEWIAYSPSGTHSGWQPATLDQEGRDAADDWLLNNCR